MAEPWRFVPRIFRVLGAYGLALGLSGLSRAMLGLTRGTAASRVKRRADGLEILFGIRAISRFLGVTRAQAHVLVRGRLIPTFDLGGVICARKPELRASIAARPRQDRSEPAG